MTRRRFLIGLLLLVVLSWLVPGAFVALYDPASPLPLECVLPDGQINPCFDHGYTASGREGSGVASGREDMTHPEEGWRARWWAQRGPLDRGAGAFPFSVGYTMEEGARLRHLRLLVTSRSDWSDLRGDAHWSEVAEARAGEDNAAQCEGVAPADTVAFRVEILIDGWGPPIWFSRNILTAPTFLGRVYDRIAYLPPFGWLPDLR